MSVNSSKVTVIIPVFNCSSYLDSALKSVFNQTYKNIDVIVTDDGSLDDEKVKSIVCNYKNIKYIRSETNKGQANALNKAVLEVKSEFIALLDCDDLYHKDKIKSQMHIIDNNEADLVFTGVTQYNEIKETVVDRPLKSFNYLMLMQDNYIARSSVLVKKKCIVNNGMFNESMSGGDDWEMWLKIALKSKIVGIKNALTTYVIHGNNTSSVRSNRVFFEKKCRMVTLQSVSSYKIIPDKFMKILILRAGFELTLVNNKFFKVKNEGFLFILSRVFSLLEIAIYKIFFHRKIYNRIGSINFKMIENIK